MKIKKKKIFSSILLILLVVLSLGFIFTQGNAPSLQLYLLLIADCLYLIWALVYHYSDKSLTLSVYLEYVLTAALALVLLLGLFI